jgi:hypothetical protein
LGRLAALSGLTSANGRTVRNMQFFATIARGRRCFFLVTTPFFFVGLAGFFFYTTFFALFVSALLGFEAGFFFLIDPLLFFSSLALLLFQIFTLFCLFQLADFLL